MKTLNYITLYSFLLFPLSIFSQVNLANDPEKIKENKISRVLIFESDMQLSYKDREEDLKYIFNFDMLGRRISTEEYLKGKLLLIKNYKYQSITFHCVNIEYCKPDENIPGKTIENVGQPYNCQDEIYSNDNDFRVTKEKNGLINYIALYLKEADDETEIMQKKEMMKDTKEPWFINVHDKPVRLLRFQYYNF